MRTRRSALIWLVPALGLPALAAVMLASPRWRDAWTSDALARPVLVMHFLATAVALIGGCLLVRRRPGNPCAWVAVALGVTFGFWFVPVFALPNDGWWPTLGLFFVYSLRPLMFWLVLAYPIGRLDRAGRVVWAIVVAGSIATFVVSVGSDAGNRDPITWWHDAVWTRLVFSMWFDVLNMIVALAVLVVVRRRAMRFSGTRGVAAPAFWAAAVAVGGDIVLSATGPVRNLLNHAGGLTPFGTVVQLIDYARWGAVVAILAYGARFAWPMRRDDLERVDLDDAAVDPSLRETLARALGDPNADVALYDARAGWLDLNGTGRGVPGTDRAATLLVHDGTPIAALEFDDSIVVHPSVVDAAVAALALELESVRQKAIAQNRELELRRLGTDVITAGTVARERLERDLHDGAQQELIGLTLQAALAARAGNTDAVAAREFASAIEGACGSLLHTALGRPPALVAERGLHAALGALLLTVPVPVRADIDECDDLPDALQRAIWFAASEAITNAMKHARATSLSVVLRRTGEEVMLVIGDDGIGGVEGSPAALAQRVADVGGRLVVASNGAGTTITAHMPLSIVTAG